MKKSSYRNIIMKICLIIMFLIINNIVAISQNYGNWISFDSLNTAREHHSAVLLSNGNILVAGGIDDKGELLSSCEIYDYNEKKWRYTSSMNYPRYKLALVQLLNNRVLAIGGEGIKNCEIFDPVTETWSLTDSLYTKRYTYNINVTLLNDGRVLVTGGYDIKDWNNRYLNICEIFDPAENKWTLTDTLKSKRAGHTMTKLKDGRILIAGGYNNDFEINKCELFDPLTDKWTLADSLNFKKTSHTAILLPDGKLLIAGGKDGDNLNNPWSSSCELYDPDKDEWTVVGSLSVSRTYTSTNFISDKLLMFSGGVHNAETWELYDINKFESVYLDLFPVDKFNQPVIITKDSSLISIAGTEVDMRGGIPLLLATNKCEIYKFGITHVEEENPIPKNFLLNQNYPNPFNPSTNIQYALGNRQFVTLKIYDILGKEIATLVNEEKSAGKYEVVFSEPELSSGVYIYKLNVGAKSIYKKMILLR